MKYTFEEEFRLENPKWDFDNNIRGPYMRWLEDKLIEARKKLSTPDAAGQSEGLCRHNNIGAANGNKMYCKDCKKWVDNE